LWPIVAFMRNKLWTKRYCACRHKVIRVFPRTPEQVDVLRTLEDELYFGVRKELFLCCRAYFNVPTGTDVLGDLKSVLEGLVTRA